MDQDLDFWRGLAAVVVSPGGLAAARLLGGDDGHGLLYRSGFMPRVVLADAAFYLGVTIARPSSGTAFRFRGGRL